MCATPIETPLRSFFGLKVTPAGSATTNAFRFGAFDPRVSLNRSVGFPVASPDSEAPEIDGAEGHPLTVSGTRSTTVAPF